jgi:hypothetical protein
VPDSLEPEDAVEEVYRSSPEPSDRGRKSLSPIPERERSEFPKRERQSSIRLRSPIKEARRRPSTPSKPTTSQLSQKSKREREMEEEEELEKRRQDMKRRMGAGGGGRLGRRRAGK